MAEEGKVKVFAGPERYKKMMEWESKHPEYKQKQLEPRGNKIAVKFIKKSEEEKPNG